MQQRQIIGIVVATVLAVLVGAGAMIYSTIRSAMSPSRSVAAAPLLQDATWLGPAFEAKLDESWLVAAHKLTLSNGTGELITQREGIARRYTVYADGKILRRGGASLVAAEPFDLRELRLELVPQMVAEAQGHTGVGVSKIVVGRDEEGLLLWRVVPSGDAVDVYFRADGSHVADPDNP